MSISRPLVPTERNVPTGVDRALVVLIVAAVLDAANLTPLLSLVMLAVGLFALGGHFLASGGQGRLASVRYAALAAIVALAGSTAISIMGEGSRPQSQLLLLLGWCYWLSLFVAFAERSTTGPFRNLVLSALGYVTSAVATIRLAEAVLFANAASAKTLLLTRNGYGAVLAVLAPIALYVWFEKSRRLGLLWTFMILLALVINASRGSWVAATAGAMVVAAAHLTRGLLRTLLLQLVGVAVLGALVFVVGTSGSLEPVRDRTETLLELDRDLSRITRLALQEKALIIVSERPIEGVGLGNFRHTTVGNEAASQLPNRITSRFGRLTAHNSYLSLLAETGFLGATPVLLIIATAIAAVLRTIRSYAHFPFRGRLAVGATILSLCVYFFLWGGLGTTLSWGLLGIWFGVGVVNRQPGRLPP